MSVVRYIFESRTTICKKFTLCIYIKLNKHKSDVAPTQGLNNALNSVLTALVFIYDTMRQDLFQNDIVTVKV